MWFLFQISTEVCYQDSSKNYSGTYSENDSQNHSNDFQKTLINRLFVILLLTPNLLTC